VRTAGLYVNAMQTAFRQEWRSVFPMDALFGLITAVGPAIIAVWLIRHSDDPAAARYLLIGAPLYAVWAQGVSRVAGSLQGEDEDALLEPNVCTLTPIFVTMLAKASAVSCAAMLPGAIVLTSLLLFAGHLPVAGDAALIAPSVVLALAAVVVTSLSFQPLTFLAGGRPNAVTAIMPIGAALAGFLYPISVLPQPLQVLARLLPVSWAMDGLAQATHGASFDTVALQWTETIAISALVLAATAFLFARAEDRIRKTGVLARS